MSVATSRMMNIYRVAEPGHSDVPKARAFARHATLKGVVLIRRTQHRRHRARVVYFAVRRSR